MTEDAYVGLSRPSVYLSNWYGPICAVSTSSFRGKPPAGGGIMPASVVLPPPASAIDPPPPVGGILPASMGGKLPFPGGCIMPPLPACMGFVLDVIAGEPPLPA